MQFLRSAFIAILGVGLLQLGSTLWWAATLTNKVEMLTISDTDQEQRIRQTERERLHP